MQSILQLKSITKSQCSLLPFNPPREYHNCTRKSIAASELQRTSIGFSISLRQRKQKSIICGRRKKRRTDFPISSKLILDLASVIVSNPKILPQPLDLIVQGLAGGDGNGGGARLWKGFGGGGFDGWRRKKKIKILIFLFLITCGSVLLFGIDVETELVHRILGFGLYGLALIQWWVRSGIKDLALLLCLWGIAVGLGMRSVELQKWVKRIRACHPVMAVAGRRSKGRRRF